MSPSSPKGDTKTRSLILTYSGIAIDPLDATVDQIAIEDIAHATANICRYTGHVREFYSVAEHSVRVAELLEERGFDTESQFNGLMHDASEAYLGDVARPIKDTSDVGTLYKGAEDILMTLIAKKYGLTWPLSEEIGWADYVLLRTEQRDLMPYPNDLYSLEEYEVLEDEIKPWEPKLAEVEFLSKFQSLSA